MLKLSSVPFFLIFFAFCFNQAAAENILYLRDNLKHAHAGDYIVSAQNKNYTLLHVYSRNDQELTLEEITIPINKYPKAMGSWKNWIQQGAPGNTSWVMYSINLKTGKMLEFYSVSKNQWFDTSEADSFLSTLLNLPFNLISLNDRKKVGFPTLPGMSDKRPLWQPRMVVEGREVIGVWFDAWKARWPKDGSELDDKTVEVYIPQESDKYPSYFPYWLQISGMISKAKIRMIDSGSHMKSPVPPIGVYRNAVINKKGD